MRRAAVTLDQAETLALQGLTFLAGDPQRLVRFLSLTGLTPNDLRAFGSDPKLQAAVLEHLLGDESLLLVFAADAGAAPEAISPALDVLTRDSAARDTP